MEQHIKETADQTIDGLKWGGEDVYIVGRTKKTRDTILDAVMELTKFPFYYVEEQDYYVLYPSKCCVVDENYEVIQQEWPQKNGSVKLLWTETYKNCRRYIGRHKDITKMQIALVEDGNDHECFIPRKNWE